MLSRDQQEDIRRGLDENPVVAILGARQVGKTTLSRLEEASWEGATHRFDLEDPADQARLSEPSLALRDLRGLVILDEVQRQPELFPLLRVLADRPERPARFLLLGSASPELVQGVSETLAGRIHFVQLGGLSLGEVGPEHLDALWIRGGFPRSYLAPSEAASVRWRQDFIRTFLERDLPQLGIGVAATTMRRFWTMLAHHHGQVLNASALSRSFGVSDTTVRSYLDTLAHTFMVQILQPWHQNVGKRQVKRPKVYLADAGLLHTLLGLDARAQVESHPVLGASWEGFAIQQIVSTLDVPAERCFFWATHAGAELDLLVVSGGRRRGFEVKRTDRPRVTRSMRSAWETLELDSLDVVHAGEHSFPLAEGMRAVALRRVGEDL